MGNRNPSPVSVNFKFGEIKARQGKFIYIAHFIHSGNSNCFTWKKLKKSE